MGLETRAALLGVIAALAEARPLDDLLAAVVDSAAALTGADGAALAVFGESGSQPSGVESLAAVGDDSPAGPLVRIARLEQVRDGGASHSVGDDGQAWLGVPVPGRERAVGALYVAGRVADPAADAFGPADADVLGALARAVGMAVGTARLEAEARAQQDWLTATAEIGSQLLAHSGEDPLRLISRRAHELSDADLVVLCLLTEDATAMVVEEAFGTGAGDILGRRFPVHETMVGMSVVQRRPLLANTGSDEERYGRHGANLRSVIDVGPLMVLPLTGTEGVRGSMSISRVRGRPAFTQTDLTFAAGFATHASVALELSDSRIAEQRVVLLEDRDRIARDLHDHVIQELFAIGLGLQSVATQLGLDSGAGSRILSRVEDLDRTIRRIRTSIFELRAPAGTERHDGLRQAALEIVSDLTPALGFAPHVGFSGAVDEAVDADLLADVTAVVREGLANVARHAHATRVNLDVERLLDELVITVGDNGVGMGAGSRRSGTANLRTRAERRGGSLEMNSAPAGGTLLIWRVPTR